MKKVLTLTLFAAILFVACEKENVQTASQKLTHNRVITLPSEGKTGNSTIMLVSIGHKSEDCTGCIVVNGQSFHVDCMGVGHYCAAISGVQLQQIGTAVTATTTDTFGLTSLDFFLMPDRSLNYTDEKGNRMFLNIPEQMVYRDTTTLQFTFTGLFFSDRAAYNNN